MDLEQPSSPRALNSSIPKDLETIVLKAIAKEPHDRYDTALELAEDLRRFLDQKPVKARRLGSMQRAWRWAKRNPAIASMTLAIGVLLLFVAAAGTVVAWKQTALAEDMRRLLYVADVNTAYQAWEVGNLSRARELLTRHRPGPHQIDLPGFEWYLLDTQLDALSEIPWVTHAKGDSANCLVFSSDGKTLITGGSDKTLKLWDVRRSPPLLIQSVDNLSASVSCLALAADGQTLAIGTRDTSLTFFNLHTGEMSQINNAHSAAIHALAFSPDGSRLASGSGDTKIKLWDVPERRERRVLSEHTGVVSGLAFSPDGGSLVSVGHDHRVCLWDVDSGELTRTIELTHRINAVAYSPNGQWLAAGGYNYQIKLWEVGSWREIFRIRRHGHTPTALAFSPDNRVLASGGRDNSVKLWDVATGRLLANAARHQEDMTSVAFSPDGHLLSAASNDGSVTIWQTDHLYSVPQHKIGGSHTTPIAFSPDGKKLAIGRGVIWSEPEEGEIRVFDIDQGTRSFLTEDDCSVLSVAFSPDGSVLAGAGGLSNFRKGWIRLWDTSTARRLYELERRLGVSSVARCVWSIAFSSDGKLLAAGIGDYSGVGETKLWDMATGMPRRLEGDPRWTLCVAFSPDIRLLAATEYGRPRTWLRLWDVTTGKLVRTLEGHSGGSLCVTFSRDGLRLASCGDDKRARLWDVATGELIATFAGHSQQIMAVAFSPDAKTLASISVDGTVKLWGVATGDELATLRGEIGFWSIAFSPDGTTLAAGDANNDVLLWHATIDKQQNWPASLR